MVFLVESSRRWLCTGSAYATLDATKLAAIIEGMELVVMINCAYESLLTIVS